MFELPDLPLAYQALEPHMSAVTMRTHHDKHHAAYIKKTNALLEQSKIKETTLEEVVRAAKRNQNKPLFNNAAQAWNHAFFWNCLTPSYKPLASGALRDAIAQKFSDTAQVRTKFIEVGETHFASGWAWIVASSDGSLKIIDLHDADTPIAEGHDTPILVCDVWEHAYYLDHKNDRKAFLEVFFDKLANWEFAAKQYDAALGKGEAWAFPPPKAKAA